MRLSQQSKYGARGAETAARNAAGGITAWERVATASDPGRGAIAWIEQHCRVPEGAHVGRPVILRPWRGT